MCPGYIRGRRTSRGLSKTLLEKPCSRGTGRNDCGFSSLVPGAAVDAEPQALSNERADVLLDQALEKPSCLAESSSRAILVGWIVWRRAFLRHSQSLSGKVFPWV